MKLWKTFVLCTSLGFATPVLISATKPELLTEKRADVSTDTDADGIPDAIEDYYDQHIRDQYMFGIGLGALISGALSMLGVAYQIVKFKSMAKNTTAMVKDSNECLHQMKEEYAKYVEEATRKLKDTVRENEALRSAMFQVVASLKESAKVLSYYSNFDQKLNAILVNQKEMAETPEYTTLGVSAKVVANVKSLEKK